MGYYVALLTDTEQHGPEELFSAKNYVPAFWPGLLDAQTLNESQRYWHELDRLVAAEDAEELYRFTDVQPALTNQYVGLGPLRRNMARTAQLLMQLRPDQLPLFEEFCNFLLAQLPGPDDGLQFDLISLGGDGGILELLASLHQQVAAFDAAAPLPWVLSTAPALLTGALPLAKLPDAAAFSLLRAATQLPAAPLAAPPARPSSWWRRLWGGC